MKHDGIAIGSLDAFDHLIVTAPLTDHPLRRKDDPIPTGLDVRRRELAAIVELHPLVQLEGIAQVILRDRPRFGQIADDLGIVMGIEVNQVVVDGAQRLGHHEGELLVHVQAGGITRKRYLQDPAAARLFLC